MTMAGVLRIASLCVLLSACESQRLQVDFYTIDGRGLSWWERMLVTLIAEAAEREARPRLPQLPEQLLLRVQPGQSFEVDEHTGDTTASVCGLRYMTIVERALVVGGGIAGMSAALCLRKLGAHVELVELDPSWKVAGAGIHSVGASLRSARSSRAPATCPLRLLPTKHAVSSAASWSSKVPLRSAAFSAKLRHRKKPFGY